MGADFAFGGGKGGAESAPVFGLVGGSGGAKEVLVGDGMLKGCVVAGMEGMEGKSTMRSEAVGFLISTGAGFPSGARGRPGAPEMPALASGLTGSVNFFEEGIKVGAGRRDEPTPEARGGCGAIGSGVRGGGVVAGAAEGILAAPRSDWVVGNAGGLVWCEMGWKDSVSFTVPLCTKTFALGLAMTTRGGENDLGAAPASGLSCGGMRNG
jgi:hypothetical protein